ncbi:MAG: hypothetical protein JST73_11520 [Actinobacteria bacterium]|nr:hypothetical protein [Actinomycetota bacterium]
MTTPSPIGPPANHRSKPFRLLVAGVAALCISISASCSATGSHALQCATNEIAPNSQPGFSGPQKALDWYLANGRSGFPKTGFALSGKTATRWVYSNGVDQISVGALPADKGAPRTWVVMLTYICSRSK